MHLSAAQNFVSEAEWARIIDGERRNKLQTYWATLEPEVKDTLAADASVRQIFRDLRLDGQLGAAAFAEGLRANTALKELKLHHTRIGDAGAAALVESLRGNTALDRRATYKRAWPESVHFSRTDVYI